MRADEQYRGDYTALTLAMVLKAAQDSAEHKQFVTALQALWLAVKKDLPARAQMKPAFLVLDGYFNRGGDIAAWLRASEEHMESLVGHVAHREALDRCKPRVWAATDFLKVLEKMDD